MTEKKDGVATYYRKGSDGSRTPHEQTQACIRAALEASYERCLTTLAKGPRRLTLGDILKHWAIRDSKGAFPVVGGKIIISPRALDKAGAVRGYARAANDKTDLEPQYEALKKGGCCEIYFDAPQSGLERGPQLKRVLASLRKGDTLKVCNLSNLSRSNALTSEIMTELRDRHVSFEVVDSSAPTQYC